MDKKIIISGIEWDTESDGEILSPNDLDLPETVEIDDKNLYNEAIADPDGCCEKITDFLSDKYGWCVKSYELLRPLSEERCLDIINSFINDISCAENINTTIEKLLDIGLTRNELIHIFNFPKTDVDYVFESYTEEE